jgi:hypothetical protein
MPGLESIWKFFLFGEQYFSALLADEQRVPVGPMAFS